MSSTATFPLFLPLLLPVGAQNLTVPHVVDGGGWQSTIVLTNTTPNAASATLIFHQETTGGNTQPWNPPFQEVVSTSGLSLAGGSSLFLHTVGTAATLSQGWAELNADQGVIGYVVFTDPRAWTSGSGWNRADRGVCQPPLGALRRLQWIRDRHCGREPHIIGPNYFGWVPDHHRRSCHGCPA